jgi:hypothetical protein
VADTCAARSRACGESPHGTASRARRWILLEQPGAWGRDALASSALPTEVGHHLRRLAREVPARVLLLRRPGGRTPATPHRSLFVGHTGPAGGWLEHLLLDDVRDVLDVGFAPLGDNEPIGGERVQRPRYLVCTNGKHDPCCAEYGLPVARTLERAVGDRVWECSHVGGDRFAGNLVCLPDGLFYGHLDPDAARTVVAANEAGRVELDRWRGRSSLPFPWQAAEAILRRERGLVDLDAARFLRADRVDQTTHRVTFAVTDDGLVEVTVREGRQATARALTCSSEPGHAPTFDLVSLREIDETPTR